MKFTILIIAAATMFTLVSSAAPGPTKANSAEPSARDKLVASFEGASEITIAYSPYVVLRLPRSKELAEKKWEVKVIYRCRSLCGKTAQDFFRFLRASIDVSNACEDFRSVIEARNADGKIVAKAWGDSSWRCIQTKEGAFALNGSLLDFLEAEWPPH